MRWVALFALVFAMPSNARAGGWTTPEGTLFAKLALYHLGSDTLFVDSLREGVFCAEEGVQLGEGERGPYDCNLDGGGGLVTTQLFLELAIGLHERVDLRLQLPIILRGEFVSDGTPSSRAGAGDLRVSGQLRFLDWPFVGAIHLAIKAPTGFFTPDAVGVPLGEGQWDIRGSLIGSRSWLDGRLYMSAELGYRLRLPNEELGFSGEGLNLGDELLAVAELGGRPLPWLMLGSRLDLLYGLVSSDGFFELPGRRVLYVRGTLGIEPFQSIRGAESIAAEFGIALPLWGRGWPGDPVVHIALSGQFSLW